MIPDFDRQLVQPAPIEDKRLQVAEPGKDTSMQLAEIVVAQVKILQVAELCKRFGPDFRRQLAEPVVPQLERPQVAKTCEEMGPHFGGNLLSLLVPRLRTCKLLSPENILAQT